MQHEQIRDLTNNDLWRAARDAEKGIRNKTRKSKSSSKKGGRLDKYDAASTSEDLDQVINEVESFVKKWEEGK